MSIHPEDAHSYADQLHTDLARIAEALERFTELFAEVIDGEPHGIHVKQAGAMTSYTVQP